MGWPSPWVTGCPTGAALVGSRSRSFPSASNPDRSRAGKREGGPAKHTSLESGSSEAAVALNLTTSGPWLKSWQIRGGLPVASNKSDHDLAIHRSLEEKGLKRYKNKGCLDYWMEHQPATGRPLSTAV